MNVKELKELIKDIPDNFEVVLSRDEEGNGFNSLSAYSIGQFEDGEYEQYVDDEGSRELLISESNCIVLWP